jgi:hypothetical protein
MDGRHVQLPCSAGLHRLIPREILGNLNEPACQSGFAADARPEGAAVKETDLSRSQVGSAGRRITRVLHFLIAFPAFTSPSTRDELGTIFKIKDH